MIYGGALVLMIGWAFVFQEFLPVVDWAYSARLLLVMPVFFSAAMTVPFPAMLALAALTGFVWDARYLFPGLPDSAPAAGDVAFGYSVLLCGMAGTFMQGIRPLFRRKRWGLPVLMVGFVTTLYLTLEYLLINFVRGGFFFPVEVWYKILTTSLLAMLVAPLLLFALYRLAKATGYRIRHEGIYYRF